MAAMPTITLLNAVDFDVIVYDSFSDQDSQNYFGALSAITTVPANTTASVQLFRPTSVLILSNAATNAPVSRLTYSPSSPSSSFAVGPADVAVMSETMAFIAFITQNPNDPLTTTFRALLQDPTKPVVQPVNDFFPQHSAYAGCTFDSYLLGVISTAEPSFSKTRPLDFAASSLTSLVNLLGGTWPSSVPDFLGSDFTCTSQNDVITIQAQIDLSSLPAPSNQAMQFLVSIFNFGQVQMTISINYGFSSGTVGTRLSFSLIGVRIQFGNSGALWINNPTATVDILSPFEFIVFGVGGSVPFIIFGHAFEADISMSISGAEADFGVVIKGDNTSLPAPPGMKGVHFDEFGVGMGVIFEPPGAAIGLSGKLHIGDPGSAIQVPLDDDTFAIVCEGLGDAPNPVYISFYIPQMHLTDVITVFTNSQTTLDVPVSFTDISFKWAENPAEPVTLPDGSLSDLGYGFTAAANILAFSFYGDVAIDLTNGLKANIAMAPLTFTNVFSMTGDGKAVTINVDANGNPIKNNQLATTSTKQQALTAAGTKQLVPAGGPMLALQTTSSPYLQVNGSVSLFEVENASLNANITSSGIAFQVAFSNVLQTDMSCTLVDPQNLSGAFTFGIDESDISLNWIQGVDTGVISIQASVNAHFTINASSSQVTISAGGNFNAFGGVRTFGDFTVVVPVSKLSDLISAMVNNIVQNAGQMFQDLYQTAQAWLVSAKNSIIYGFSSAADVLHRGWDQTVTEITSLMQSVGYIVNDIVTELKFVFSPSEVASALLTTMNMAEIAVATAMQQAKYDGVTVAGALKDTFGPDAKNIASAMQSAYGWSVSQIQSTLGGIGFTAQQIGNAFTALGGDFEQPGEDLLQGISS